MNKCMFFVCLMALLVIQSVVVFGDGAVANEVVVKVVYEDGGEPIGGVVIGINVKNRAFTNMRVKTDQNGNFNIGENYVGKKVLITGDEVVGDWAEIKTEGTVVYCKKRDKLSVMVNPWGHSRPSPPHN